jgi:hypothetical protein
MHEEHDCTAKTAPETFMTEVSFVDWLKTLLPPGLKRGGSECNTKAQLYFSKFLWKKENKVKTLKGQTLKIYWGLAAF